MNSNQNGGPPPGSRYCSCKARAIHEHPDTGEPLCDKHYEEDQRERDLNFLREMRQEYEDNKELERKREVEDAKSIDHPEAILLAQPVGLRNYIKVELLASGDGRPVVRVLAIVGQEGKWVEYNLEQYEGLMTLMLRAGAELKEATEKFEASK